MGLMDAFTADARVELKVGELYDVLRVAASHEKTARHLMNAVKCEVPYKYIREIMTGEKEVEDEEETAELCKEVVEDIFRMADEEMEAESGGGEE